jgi:hypothetical protein
MSSDWGYAQTDPSEQLARLYFFSMIKHQDGQEIEFTIKVKEYVTPKDGALLFFAEADKQTNQQLAPYTPTGWGRTMLVALSECMKNINRFPYHEADSTTANA